MRLSLIFLACGLAFVFTSSAQDNYRFTSYTVDDGLPQSTIWSIVQDKNGFMWFGTADGLCRFDGYHFTVYKNDPKDTNSISSNRDVRMYVDKQSRLWAVSFAGVSLYNDTRDNFSNVFNYSLRIPIDSYNTIFGEDDQYIWAGICSYGIIKIDKHTLKTTLIKPTGSIPVTGVLLWSGGFVDKDYVWACADRSRLLLYNKATGRITEPDPSHAIASAISINDSQALAGRDRELFLFSKKDLSVRRFSVELDHIKGEAITQLLKLPSDELLLVTSRGLYYFNLLSKTVVRRMESFNNRQTKSYTYPQCVFYDRSGNLWIGTNGDGLKKLPYAFKRFKYYSSYSPTGNLVKSIYASARKLYVGYYDNGMDIFDRVKGFEENIAVNRNFPRLPNVVYSIVPMDSSNLVLNQETSIYNIPSRNVKLISAEIEKVLPGFNLLRNSHPFLFRRGNGVILTDIAGFLIALNEPGSVSIKTSIINHFENEMLSCCFEDHTGRLWVGTIDGVFCQQEKAWRKVELPENVEIKTINEGTDGSIWIGTVRGIYVLEGNRTIHFTESNGLSNQFIYGILRDDSGNMWFSHNKGISEYLPSVQRFRHYTFDDGLQSNEFNTGAYFKAADGELFFGGVYGTNSFRPEEIGINPNAPGVKITSVKLFDVPLETDTAYWNIKSLVLPYDQNSLSFEFAATEYSDPKRNEYAYKMEGLDKAWINVGDRHFARYAGLAPGQYVFKLKACNADGVWTVQPSLLAITIVPPYWQRLWFRLLCVVGFVSVITGIVLQVQKQRHKKAVRALELQQKIQLERERISRDLHDNVGTQLSLISNNIDWVTHPLKDISEQEKEDKLQSVTTSAKEVIATLRETIWALNKEQITLEEFSDKLKAFAQKQLAAFASLTLIYNEENTADVILGPAEALNLFRICQEAIANSLKYAKATELNVSISATAGRYIILIADNGIGFELNSVDLHAGFGLENMKYRAQEIGCVVFVHSEPASGTRVTISKK